MDIGIVFFSFVAPGELVMASYARRKAMRDKGERVEIFQELHP